MTRRSIRSLAALAVLVVVVGVWYVWLTSEIIYLAASSNTKRIVVAITWNTTVFGMVDAHLVIKDFYGSTLYRTLLLRNRDHFIDVESEFRGLDISEDSVRLQVFRNHYQGPDRFPLPALKEPRVLKR